MAEKQHSPDVSEDEDKMDEGYAYATFISKPSEIPGAIILAFSLRRYKAQHPFVILHPRDLPAPELKALELESPQSNLVLTPVSTPETLNALCKRGSTSDTPKGTVPPKLRAFSPLLSSFEMVCWLDCDMLICNTGMDEVFDLKPCSLGASVVANYMCCCSALDYGGAPSPINSKPENCPYHYLRQPHGLTDPRTSAKTFFTGKSAPQTFNTGMFVLRRSSTTYDQMLSYLTDHEVQSVHQFLNDFFHGKWVHVGWQYSAQSTMRIHHSDLWEDKAVICIHYLNDNPWSAEPQSKDDANPDDGDNSTRKWWWEEFEAWEKQRRASRDTEVIDVLRKHIVPPGGISDVAEASDTPVIDTDPCRSSSTTWSEDPSNGYPSGSATDSEAKSYEAIYRHKRHAERGHGPVVHPASTDPDLLARRWF
ncbi:nucleotide-diphospho-sugar transferase [Trichodelitschia bisporula]|uniref:Nucleotide-diphospho-sugar transferase n=1 Tax=Trichodelitschia bisporula TaxID=703511 RepID=A0A6G1I7R1_9PEZI|nr:nucleotide-diphospho-sugar transferase [Trichodelitschia bisporula]